MPRISPIPEEEKVIGRRLREFREDLLISQTSFALKAGISRENLAKYEFGLVPLPWSAGDALCRAHNINQRWLLTGEEPPRALYLRPPDELVAGVRPRSLFSDVCRDFLADKKRQWAVSASVVPIKILLQSYSEAKKLRKEGRLAPEAFAEIESKVLALEVSLREILKRQSLE